MNGIKKIHIKLQPHFGNLTFETRELTNVYALIRTCIVEKSLRINKRVYTLIRNGRVDEVWENPICWWG